MNTSQKFLSGIILGVAAGVAIILLSQTDKGKNILSDVSDAAGDAKDNFNDKLNSVEKQFKELVKKGKAFINDLEDKAKDITSAITD